jgi:hypothetical protein
MHSNDDTFVRSQHRRASYAQILSIEICRQGNVAVVGEFDAATLMGWVARNREFVLTVRPFIDKIVATAQRPYSPE